MRAAHDTMAIDWCDRCALRHCDCATMAEDRIASLEAQLAEANKKAALLRSSLAAIRVKTKAALALLPAEWMHVAVRDVDEIASQALEARVD